MNIRRVFEHLEEESELRRGIVDFLDELDLFAFAPWPPFSFLTVWIVSVNRPWKW